MNKTELKEFLISFIFPKRCKFCDSVVKYNESSCEKCENSLNRITGEICFKCGMDKENCDCKEHKSYYIAIASPFYYDGAIGNTIRLLKFRKKTHLSKTIAEEMANCYYEKLAEYSPDVVTFVPMHKNQQKKRGFNQAELVTREMCEILNLPCEDILIKTETTDQQHMLDESERTGNLLGVFSVKEDFDLTDKRVLLCDDIKTTGATLNECAKTLLINGASDVICLTSAITRKKKKNKSNKDNKNTTSTSQN